MLMIHDEVSSALDILLEEIESYYHQLSEEGAEALKNEKLEKAKKLLTAAEQISAFKKKVKNLQDEWIKVHQRTIQSLKHKLRRRGKRKRTKLPKGSKTPAHAYRLPLLEALVELGGSAPKQEVINIVGKKMKDRLLPVDLAPLPSGREIRWQNTVAWCRHLLIKEGLLKNNSPRGLWEISERGRAFLESNQL